MDVNEELGQLYQVLQGILSNDNTLRTQAEAKLKSLYQQPDKFMLYLTKLLQGNQPIP